MQAVQLLRGIARRLTSHNSFCKPITYVYEQRALLAKAAPTITTSTALTYKMQTQVQRQTLPTGSTTGSRFPVLGLPPQTAASHHWPRAAQPARSSAAACPCIQLQHAQHSRFSSWSCSSQQPQARIIKCHDSVNSWGETLHSIHPSIAWLCNIQQWPSPAADHSSNGYVGSNGNGNGTPAAHNLHNSTREQFDPIDAADLASMDFDAIVVLAGGLLPDGSLPEWAERRVDVARDLHMLLGRRTPILCSGGGTPHKPSIIAPNGHVLHESTSMATYLMDGGVDPNLILKETASYDTVGNTYMSLAIHAVPSNWRRIAVVTSDFHMPRTRALFAGIYGLAASSLFNDPHRYSLTFLSASDMGVFDDYVYAARLEKEAGSVRHWQAVSSRLHSLQDVHEWLHTDHLCYAVPRQHEFGRRTIQDEKLLESY